MNARSNKISRRALLQGVGVSMALPWLESLPAWGKAPASGTAAPKLPQRFAALFMGNGISVNDWWAKGAGTDMELSKTLQPLAAFRGRMNVISGLFNKQALLSQTNADHPPQTANLLSGVKVGRGANVRGGTSVDQVLAEHLGEETALRSLVLGCEQPRTGYTIRNYTWLYSSHISWKDPNSPVPKEIYPSLAFDSLFDNHGGSPRGGRMLSVLDRVKEDATALRREVSSTDRAKLDEYLTSVREVEKRVERSRTDKTKADERARDRGQPALTMRRPDNGLPEDIRDHLRLTCDLLALAFQTNKTRVATLILCQDFSDMTYPFLGLRNGHHGETHGGKDYEKMVRFHVSQVAYLADRLAKMPEGDSTVLDNSCLMFLSNMWNGDEHDASQVPVVLLGGLGGKLATGRVLNYLHRGDDNRKLCSLYLSLMNKMEVKVNQFGDATSPLAEL